MKYLLTQIAVEILPIIFNKYLTRLIMFLIFDCIEYNYIKVKFQAIYMLMFHKK